MEQSFKEKVRKGVLFYNILLLVVVCVFYFAIPKLLNYPPDSINNEFERTIDMGINYYVQYGIIVVIGMFLSNMLLFLQLRKVRGWMQIADGTCDDESLKKRIVRVCFTAPTRLYLIHVFIPTFAVCVGLLLTGAGLGLALKISVCMMVMFMVLGLLMYLLSKDIFNDVLVNISNSMLYTSKVNTNSYKRRILLQIAPIIIFTSAFVYLVSIALFTEEKSQLLFEKYSDNLADTNFESVTSIEEVKNILNSCKKIENSDTHFIISNSGVVYKDSDEDISDFFIKYTFNIQNGGHTYGYYASDVHGVYKMLKIDGESYAAGMMYHLQTLHSYREVAVSFFILFGFAVIFLLFFADDFSDSISEISKYMKKLSGGASVDYSKKLPVVSNDEIGELTVNFNEILDLEKSYVETIKQNQDMLVENERLSSLGQLIGGIAHSLKTPIMSVSGHLVALERLADEYEQSIGNPSVTAEDYHEITSEMKDWINKSKEYMSYMTEVINAAKGQAVSMNANTIGSFSMKELVMRTQILMKEELTKYNCNLDVKLNIAEETEIRGELSALVQVLDNLISNAMQAYDGKEGKIIVSADEDQDKVYIKIQDFAGGIPEHIKDKLFKEMITTKGKNGTGLGLYMCYSTIKGKFNGDLRFESETGVGTTFFITLNKVK